ncbi:hypothetical protein QN239_32880 [Mycolicibacterium sp. Y3]
MSYEIRWDNFTRQGHDDDKARVALAEVFAHIRGRTSPDDIDVAQAVHAVNALNNAGATIIWPKDVTALLSISDDLPAKTSTIRYGYPQGSTWEATVPLNDRRYLNLGEAIDGILGDQPTGALGQTKGGKEHGMPAQSEDDDDVLVPVEAEFFRVADAARDGNDPIAPVSIMAAQPGDLVVHAGAQVGIYVGGGKMRRQADGQN